MSSQAHQTAHHATIGANPERVYRIIAEVTQWPRIFGPTVHARVLESTGTAERIQLWATANGQVKTWVSARERDEENLRIRFSQEVSQHPVASMSGEWILRPTPEGGTAVELTHEFTAVGDEPEHVRWISTAVENNSTAELAALRRAAELPDDSLLLEFTDEVLVRATAAEVYQFLYEAAQWPQRLPHVARLELTEDAPGIQVMSMDTRTPDGSSHTTESIRVGFPDSLIVYKQTTVPALMTAHTGFWRLDERPDGVVAVAGHTVVIKPEAIEAVLGAGKTVADARDYIRRALGANSSTTLRAARDHVEARTAALSGAE